MKENDKKIDITEYYSFMNYSNKIHPCVKCGFCCGIGHENPTICSYGRLNEKKTRCDFLVEDDKEIGTYKCLIYREIKEIEKDSRFPMFDCGCSSSLFNNIRDNVLNKMMKIREK